VIRVEQVSKSFGAVKAVQDVTLTVGQGDIFGLVGPDGAGKTTLLRIICGLIAPDAGKIFLMDRPPELIREQFGYMPQKFSLYGDLTIMENIHFFGSLYGIPPLIIQERAEEILSVTNLLPFKDRWAQNLSGGMKQKLALTCSLIRRPSILVLDEPTYGVDPESRKEFWRILYQLNQEGLTIILSTPYMDEAELCKRVGLINEGVLSAMDSPHNLKKAFPHHILEVRAPIKDPGFFDQVTGIIDSSFFGYKYHLVVDNVEATVLAVRQHAENHMVSLHSIKEIKPSMEDVFVSLV
jgi:ABC-2 type transport system ATP-binding protein